MRAGISGPRSSRRAVEREVRLTASRGHRGMTVTEAEAALEAATPRVREAAIRWARAGGTASGTDPTLVRAAVRVAGRGGDGATFPRHPLTTALLAAPRGATRV